MPFARPLALAALLGALVFAAVSGDAPIPSGDPRESFFEIIDPWVWPSYYDANRSAAPYWNDEATMEDFRLRAQEALVAIGCGTTWSDPRASLLEIDDALFSCRATADVATETAEADALAAAALANPDAGRAELQKRFQQRQAIVAPAIEALQSIELMPAIDMELAIHLVKAAPRLGDGYVDRWLRWYDDAFADGEPTAATISWLYFQTFDFNAQAQAIADFITAFEWQAGACHLNMGQEHMDALVRAFEDGHAIASALAAAHPDKPRLAKQAARLDRTDDPLVLEGTGNEYILADVAVGLEQELHTVILFAENKAPTRERAMELSKEALDKYGSLSLYATLANRERELQKERWWMDDHTPALYMSALGTHYFPAIKCT